MTDHSPVTSQVLPWSLLGALAGAVFAVMGGFGEKKAKVIRGAFDGTPSLQRDALLVELCFNLQYFLTISPDLKERLHSNLDLLIHIWFDFMQLSADLGEAIDGLQSLETSKRIALEQQISTVALRKATAHTCVAVVETILTDLVALSDVFNYYWLELGPLFMADGQADEKLRVANFVREHGLLPSIFIKISNDANKDPNDPTAIGNAPISTTHMDMTAEMLRPTTITHIRWWSQQHVLYQPSMANVCHSWGYNSEYAPNNGAGQVPLANHPFPEESPEAPPKLLKRPNAETGLWDQALFLLARTKQEGVSSVLKDPYAGYQPAVYEAGFLPTSIVTMRVLRDIVSRLLTTLHAYNMGVDRLSADIDSYSMRIKLYEFAFVPTDLSLLPDPAIPSHLDY